MYVWLLITERLGAWWAVRRGEEERGVYRLEWTWRAKKGARESYKVGEIGR